MSMVDSGSRLGDGMAALFGGEWAAARAAFEDALATGDDPEALDGLGRALWWLRDPRGAVVHRERAYAGFRRHGELARAARIALWLSREYALVWGNAAASNGWMARAERLLASVAPGAGEGWLELARSERTHDPAAAARHAGRALELGLGTGDPDLELRALAQLGHAEIAAGRLDEGLGRLDEAMAAVTSGEPAALETFADVCCTLLSACELAGDRERPAQWTQVLESFARSYDHVPLLAFCRTCCAGVHVAGGRIDDAEEELLAALRDLTAAGQRARCIHPAARLAELRVAQGRLEEADALLTGFEDEPAALDAAVGLRLARGEPESAARMLERRLAGLEPESLASAPMLARLVDARLAAGDVDGARGAAAGLERIAEPAGRDRVVAAAILARGRIALATDGDGAVDLLREAVNGYAELNLRGDGARARLDLARALAAADEPDAVEVARRALTELEALGAIRQADEAAALLRSLGSKGRAAPRAAGALSRRELEVLRLLGEGLTNAEIAKRLVISPKTAEHHVARVFRKLGVRTRSEAAVYAARNLGSK